MTKGIITLACFLVVLSKPCLLDPAILIVIPQERSIPSYISIAKIGVYAHVELVGMEGDATGQSKNSISVKTHRGLGKLKILYEHQK